MGIPCHDGTSKLNDFRVRFQQVVGGVAPALPMNAKSADACLGGLRLWTQTLFLSFNVVVIVVFNQLLQPSRYATSAYRCVPALQCGLLAMQLPDAYALPH